VGIEREAQGNLSDQTDRTAFAAGERRRMKKTGIFGGKEIYKQKN
jgi:hypothetical protein